MGGGALSKRQQKSMDFTTFIVPCAYLIPRPLETLKSAGEMKKNIK
jgi:hypothetical protein